MDKILAIKGHPTRGKEVLEILEMLGNKNDIWNGNNTNFIYYSKPYCDYILAKDIKDCDLTEFTIFTLEEFLEKYPYKIGDKVYNIIHNENQIITNIALDFKENEVVYQTNNNEYIYVNYLQSKTMDNFNNDSKPGVTVNGEKLIPPKGYIIKTATMDGDNLTVKYVKNKPQYPKTFQECYSLKYNGQINLNIGCDILHGAYSEELECLQSLLICRDAYWKIAGEEMGLGKSWKPVWGRNQPNNYVLHKVSNTILRATDCVESEILAFPTKEMRDAFFENFKDLIEECKEFLL